MEADDARQRWLVGKQGANTPLINWIRVLHRMDPIYYLIGGGFLGV